MDRKYDAKFGALKSPEFKTMAKKVLNAFGRDRVALVGGLAVSYYANPPVTMDADFLVLGSCGDAMEGAEEWFASPQWQIDIMKFDGSVPEHCIRVACNKPPMIVDLLTTGRVPYLKSIVARAVEVEVQTGLRVPIAQVEDVIVMKTIARRDKDLADIGALGVKLGKKIDQQYIQRILASGFR